ncbi:MULTISPECIES: ABC transporter substrate-binding protein [Streptomyces]|uniref:ABC transporter substrate-binding protein n=1 Tax=Streptomyces TaxID=1883 RepID=UPI001D1312D1|nr:MULTISPECIES: extracellular solute-binding protein [Streptomyces]
MTTHTKRLTRRVLPALAVVGAMTLTACGGGDSGGDGSDGGDVTLRVAWWGSDERQRITEEAIAKFEEQNEGIKIQPEYSTFDAYYDQLTTQVASNDAPDVFAVEIRRLGELARGGVMADLDGLVGTDDLNQELLESGAIDGVQYGIPTGANAFAVMANTKVFEDAGIDLPDDTSWTWEDYMELSAELTDTTDSGLYGTQISNNDAFLKIFAAQRGEAFYGEGELAVSEETVTDWFAYQLEQIDEGATPDGPRSVEIGENVETSLVATNTGAMGMWWTNQLGTLTAGSGEEVELLRMPSDAGAQTGGMFLQPTMFWTVSGNSAKQEAAGKLVDFLVNDPEAGAIMGSDRGLPMNSSVLDSIRDGLPEADVKSLAFIDDISDETDVPPTALPGGAGEIPNLLKRYSEEVYFERMTPQEAAAAFITEANSVLS